MKLSISADVERCFTLAGVNLDEQVDLDAFVKAAGFAVDIKYNSSAEPTIESPNAFRDYLKVKLRGYHHEVFCVIFLDNRHRVIAFEEMFRGTINASAVYPREVVKRALELNAAAVTFVHNHPSGVAEPSMADRSITDRLKVALGTVDIRSLDHLVIGNDMVSFAERGWI